MDDLTEQAIAALRTQMAAGEALAAERIKALQADIIAKDALYAERFEASQRQRTEAIDAMRARVDAYDQRQRDLAIAIGEQRKAAEFTLEKRLDGMNEFRATIQDHAATLLPRREFEQVRDSILARIEAFRPGLGERVTAQGELLATLVPRREFDEARNVILDKIEAQRKTGEAQLVGATEPLRARVDAVSRPNWALMASAISILMVVIAGASVVIGLKIDGAISPVQLSLEQTKVSAAAIAERVRVIDTASQASAQADQVSRSDRMQINDRLRLVESTQSQRAQAISDIGSLKMQVQQNTDRQAENRAENTRQAAALIEIETQFCASDIMRNLQHANDMRITSLLWSKSFDSGLKLPTDNAYYPQICNRPQATGVMPGGR